VETQQCILCVVVELNATVNCIITSSVVLYNNVLYGQFVSQARMQITDYVAVFEIHYIPNNLHSLHMLLTKAALKQIMLVC